MFVFIVKFPCQSPPGQSCSFSARCLVLRRGNSFLSKYVLRSAVEWLLNVTVWGLTKQMVHAMLWAYRLVSNWHPLTSLGDVINSSCDGRTLKIVSSREAPGKSFNDIFVGSFVTDTLNLTFFVFDTFYFSFCFVIFKYLMFKSKVSKTWCFSILFLSFSLPSFCVSSFTSSSKYMCVTLTLAFSRTHTHYT